MYTTPFSLSSREKNDELPSLRFGQLHLPSQAASERLILSIGLHMFYAIQIQVQLLREKSPNRKKPKQLELTGTQQMVLQHQHLVHMEPFFWQGNPPTQP